MALGNINQSTAEGQFYIFQYLQANAYNTPENAVVMPIDDDNQDGVNDWTILDLDGKANTDPYFDGVNTAPGGPSSDGSQPLNGFAAAA